MLYSIDRRRGAGIDRPARISLRLGVAFAGTAAVAMMLFSAVDKIRNAADRSH